MKHLHLRSLIISASSVVLCVSIVGCTPKKVVSLPVGPQTLTGALSPVDLSLTRRGTDVLRQNGHDVYYVESSVINLRNYEGMDVTITGTIEANSDPQALPVLVATKADIIEEPSHSWTVPALHLTFSAPLAWNGEVFDDGVSFTQTGSTTTLVSVHRSSLSSLPSGTPLVVGGERAVRVEAGSGTVVYVQNGSDIIVISLDKSLSNPSGKDLAQSILQMLKSMVFATPTSASSTGTGTLTGSPCGGPAGILCPAGSYCAVQDAVAGIGVCQPLGVH